MRIAFIAPYLMPVLARPGTEKGTFGGAEVQQMLLARYLVKQGQEVKALVRAPVDPGSTEVDGIKLLPFAMRYTGASNLWLPLDLVSLFGALDKADADVYIMKLPRVLLGAVGSFTRIRRKKLVFWLAIDRDVNLSDVERIDGRLARMTYRFGLNFPDHVIAQSRYQLQRCRLLGRDATLIPSLVEMGRPDWAKSKPFPPRVLWVGSTNPRKRAGLFLEIVRSLPETSFRMIASSRSEAEGGELKKRAGPIPNLEFLGEVPYAHIGRHYREASLLVSTSEVEGMPNTFLQSWANGTPVASLAIDPDGVIEKGGLGVYARGDVELLKRQIKRLVGDRELRTRMGRRARTYVAQNHSIQIVGPRYIELFHKVSRANDEL